MRVLRLHRSRTGLATGLLAGLLLAAPAAPQEPPGEGLVQLDFQDAELSAVIDTIARLTDTNFIYDDRVRGRVTIVSPTPMPVEQAYAVFESVLQVKGFTTVRTPGGALKIIPLRDAKESSIETRESVGPPLDRDRFVTRLIPLRYIDAESIVNTLKPLVSKDAAMAAYQPTNTVILTESASNIRRIMAILESIDVESYKEELAVIRVEYADAASLASQISEIYGAEVDSTSAAATRTRSRRTPQPTPSPSASPTRGRVRILTDDRTNSLIVLAARSNLEDVRDLVRKLDVPVSGGGRIHVYYLNHANAEELTQTLSSLISGQPRTPAGGPPGGAAAAGGTQAQALRATVAGLTEGITVTADPATNSLVIQASQEGYATIRQVIEKLDVQRPQVLVEALIMEVDVTDSTALGINWLLKFMSGSYEGAIASATEAATRGALAGATGGASEAITPVIGPFVANIRRTDKNSSIQAIISASAADANSNIISAPHILTSDNEQAEIRIGDNIPIISSRVQSAAGLETGLSTSVNVERQDVGVTLRVTPQITEGDTLRMEIFQEITAINQGLQEDVGNAEEVGVPLSNRRVENTVVVDDGETVVIGGLISEEYQDTVGKVPWFGDIPVLGWAFKSTDKTLRKVNLLVFLTPHIIREAEDLEKETIRKREEFISGADEPLQLGEKDRERIDAEREAALARGETYEDPATKNPVRTALLAHEGRYPAARLTELEEQQRIHREAMEAEREAAERADLFFLQAAVLDDETEAVELLTDLVDSGWDGTLISGDVGGRTLFEVRLGPFESLDDARVAGEAVARSHGLRPSVLVLGEEEP
jgi:general secretion pathway protein D